LHAIITKCHSTAVDEDNPHIVVVKADVHDRELLMIAAPGN
jgi:hypothetical protein